MILFKFHFLAPPILEESIQKHLKNVVRQELGPAPFFEFLMTFYLQVMLYEMNQT